MKKILTLVLIGAAALGAATLSSCSKYDDSELRERVEELERQMTEMKTLVAQLDAARKAEVSITDYTALPGGAGWKISFSDGSNIEVRNGAAGATPEIRDGRWWIGTTDTGVKAAGTDGTSPEIKDGRWWIGSTDTGVDATGAAGAADALIENIGDAGDNVVITLADGREYTFPKAAPLVFADVSTNDIQPTLVNTPITNVDLKPAVSGGKAPYTFALSQGSALPEGLTLDPATGVISGTPTAVTPAGTARITVEDSSAPKQRKEATIDYGDVAPILPIIEMGTAGHDITWILYEGGTMIIDGTGAMPDYNNSVSNPAPWFPHRAQINQVVIGAGVTAVGNYAFYDCTSLETVSIGNGVTAVGNYAFYDCTSLETVSIGNGVTAIGYYAFFNCIALTDVTIPAGVTEINGRTFSQCTSLVEITIPENVTTIWDNAFLDCSSLTEITIPANVTRIGFGVFSGNVLATVTCLAAVPPTLEAYNFGGTGDVLYVPAGSVDAYKADVMWNAAFAGNIVVIP